MINTEFLIAAGYSRDVASALWMRDGYNSIAYNDGDEIEERLEAVIVNASDLSVFSPELASACVDWPTRYHLSTERSNLLRPFQNVLSGARVLEIGAGCGAITRYLGECGSEVVALEGSLRRARITRARTRDLPNVEVLAERFQDFNTEHKFDVVTLIGVLEYASVFLSEDNAAEKMLTSIKSLLRSNGRLIIAIENKIGLKYLAGVPEDHLGVPMAGVEDRYSADGPRTFGKWELESLLALSGYSSSRFFCPIPDYKMPTTIITEKGANVRAACFDVGSLLSQGVRRDPQLTDTHFNLQRVWPVVSNNKLSMELANSFLVEAFASENDDSQEGILAYHYSTQRVARFARQTTFIGDANSEVVSVTTSLINGEQDLSGPSCVKIILNKTDSYHSGRLLVDDIRQTLTKSGWLKQDLVRGFSVYLSHLQSVFELDGHNELLKHGDVVLPDDYIDATPSNLLLRKDGSVVYIDREWSVDNPTLHWLMIRSVLFTYSGTAVSSSDDAGGMRLRDLIMHVLAELELPLSNSRFDEYIKSEEAVQEAVTGKNQSSSIAEMLAYKVPGESPDQKKWKDGVMEGIQHSMNLSAQHGMNLYSLVQSVAETLSQEKELISELSTKISQLEADQAQLLRQISRRSWWQRK